MNAPAKLSKVERIRARDGERCWLCDGKLSFGAAANSSKAPTLEHLLAKSLGGTDSLDNLVLTHKGCNNQLGNRPLADKQRMRAKQHANREKTKAAGKSVAAPQAAKAKQLSAPVNNTASVAAEKSRPSSRTLRLWQAAALSAGGLALLSLGFAAGLLVGR